MLGPITGRLEKDDLLAIFLALSLSVLLGVTSEGVVLQNDAGSWQCEDMGMGRSKEDRASEPTSSGSAPMNSAAACRPFC